MTRSHVLGFLLVLAAAGVTRADVQVGETRAAQARDGVPLRADAKALAKMVELVPYGTKVSVLEVKSYYARVTVSTTGTTGWVRAADIVEPPVLTGRELARASTGAAGVSTADVSAAGRQFDDATEADYKASHADVAAAFPLIDALEKKTPNEIEISAFIRDGRLGR